MLLPSLLSAQQIEHTQVSALWSCGDGLLALYDMGRLLMPGCLKLWRSGCCKCSSCKLFIVLREVALQNIQLLEMWKLYSLTGRHMPAELAEQSFSPSPIDPLTSMDG